MDMTLRELENYRKSIQDLREVNELLMELRGRATPGSPALDGMPHGTGTSDKVGRLAIAIADLEATIPVYEDRIRVQSEDVNEFIDSIPDAKTRIIFRLRFQNALSWKDVAATCGRWETEASVRSRCYRYMNLSSDGWYQDEGNENDGN